MAKSKAQVQFETDTSGFNSSIKEADDSLKTLRKELNLNSAELKNNADDVDLLAKRKSILQQEADESAKKVEALKNKLEVAKTSFGENSREVQNLKNKLLDAQTSYQKIQNEIQQTDTKLNNLEGGLNDVEQDLKNADTATDDLGDGFTTLNGVCADLISEGIQELSDSLGQLVEDSDTAFSSFQAQTGASADEMAEFEEKIEEIYANNFGENLNDIANSMAEVKQQTKEVDPTKLKDMTENALALRDTFDFDVSESMRAVNQLMTQFGISSDEAFNLIVQGAQNGLNANGDMLDVINEYSVHYEHLGLSADDMFNSLLNGAEQGTFSIDKLGDAMKEFGIRSQDMSDATLDAYVALGLDVDEISNKFAEGGDSARDAFNQVLDGLANIEDPMAREKNGIALFGR